MLRVALPDEGALSGPAARLLADAGYRVHRGRNESIAVDPDTAVQFVFMSPMDIARTAGAGVLDVAITGQDLLAEAASAEHVVELLELGFGGSALFFAVPATSNITEVGDLDGARVATSFPHVLGAAEDLGIKVDPVVLDGAVGIALELGLADAIADVVETGASPRTAGVVTVGGPIMTSQAVLVRGCRTLPHLVERAIEVLTARLRGVLIARRYVLVDYRCPADALDDACALTSGLESPAVSWLDEPGWAAVRAMVPRSDVQVVLDRLWKAGGRGILVTPVEACRR